MLDVEYAQLSQASQHRDSRCSFASIIPMTLEERRTHGWLFALADEVSNENESKTRAASALESVASGFRSASPYELHRALLPRLIQQANSRIKRTNEADAPPVAFLASALRSDCAVVCHVGDVRCYLVRRGHAELLTRDHILENDPRRLGLAPSRNLDNPPARATLARSLGNQLFVAVDVTECQIIAGDVLLACSYGFYSRVEQTDMELIVSDNRDLSAGARELVIAATKSGHAHDASVQLIRVKAEQLRKG